MNSAPHPLEYNRKVSVVPVVAETFCGSVDPVYLCGGIPRTIANNNVEMMINTVMRHTAGSGSHLEEGLTGA